MENDNVQFIDAEQQFSQEQFGFREIVLQHLRRITEISSREFRAGYWKMLYRNPSTPPIPVWIEDTRDAYINAVNMLHDLLLPKFDKIIEEEDNRVEKYEEDLEQDLKEKNKDMEEKEFKKLWKDELLEIKRYLFQQLSLLLDRLGYLEGKVIKE